MFKKAFQVATAFGLLMAGYALYVRAFATLSDRLARSYVGAVVMVPVHSDSETQKKAIEVAEKANGAGHWSTDGNLGYRYYNAERGFWMYAQVYSRSADGKRLEFKPFTVVSHSRDGKSMKVITSDSAVIDLDSPLGLQAGPMHVVHARLNGNVKIRDDKGTPEDLTDDLRIGPMTYIEYDDPTLQIKTDSAVVLEDRDTRATGVGLLIMLRPKEPATPGAAQAQVKAAPGSPGSNVGFNGAQTVYLKQKVHITFGDVGSSGILPGAAQGKQKAGPKTPMEVRCDSVMQIDLPKPVVPPKEGAPPVPPEPTMARFFRNVEVTRGTPGQTPDRLNCDELVLTLMPADKKAGAKAAATPTDKPATEPAAAAAGGGGPLTDLTLRKAVATGHNVRIASASQGFMARGTELIHEKHLPESADTTFLKGNGTTKLIVEKVDVAANGPEAGKVTSFTTIRTIDATIFDDGSGSNNASIVSHGPGDLETRPAADKPVERTARWDDTLTLQNVPAEAPAESGRRITLTGHPAFADIPAKSALAAEQTLVVWLKPKAKDPGVRPASASGPAVTPVVKATIPTPAVSPAGAYEIDRLLALKNVKLTAPGKTLTARERLDAVFESTPAGTTTVAVAASNTTPAGPSSAAATPAPAAAPASPTATPPAKAADPEARAIADRVWARVIHDPQAADKPGAAATTVASSTTAPSPLGISGGKGSRVEKVFLRGRVAVHQDPGAGKVKGTDVKGEAVDLHYQGNGQTKFVVFSSDPSPQTVQNGAKLRPTALGPDGQSPGTPPAVVETDEMTIRGAVIGLDQSVDQAWVEGVGDLTMLAARGLLSDKAPGPNPGQPVDPKAVEAAKAKEARTPMTISWTTGMRFFGQSVDPSGKPVARAEFYDNVRAVSDESLLNCDDIMRTYFDRTVKLTRPPGAEAGGKPAEGADADREPRANLDLIECVNNVEVVNLKPDPANPGTVLEAQRIRGEYLIYKRATGQFRVPGAGEVYLYQRDGEGGNRLPGAPARPNAGAAAKAKPKAKPKPGATPPTLTLTQVKFSRDMVGRFGSGKEGERGKNESRWADFFGDIEVLHGSVAGPNDILDADKRTPESDTHFLTSQILRVISEPPLPGKAADAPPRYLLRAWQNANASTGSKTIAADVITYDSQKDLFYAYGENGRNVLVNDQTNVGQGFTNLNGRAAMYNHKTGAAELIEPGSFAILDTNKRAGTRPEVLPPPPADKPMKPKRTPFRNLRGNIERKDFNGR